MDAAPESYSTSAEPRLIGQLDLSSVHLSAAVVEGDDDSVLRRAIGYLPDTPLPWQDGNSALAGHRNSFFRPLQHIRIGDDIRFATTHGELRYRVRRTLIVDPEDVVRYPLLAVCDRVRLRSASGHADRGDRVITALYVVATELLKVEHAGRRIGTDPFADLTPDRRFPAVAAGRGEQSTPPSSGDAP